MPERWQGAAGIIDYTKEDFTRSGQRYDVILDLVGNHPLSACRRCLTPAGTLVLSSGKGGRVSDPSGGSSERSRSRSS